MNTRKLADEQYAKLRRRGRIGMGGVDDVYSEKDFERLLAALRRRAKKDGYAVYTCLRSTPMILRAFELHHRHDKSKSAHAQPRGIATPDAPRPDDRRCLTC